MAGESLTIAMNGGAPWGFRLYGGETDPLVVAKIRKRSKAYEGGLREDDVLLGINGVSCHGMNHGTAMGLVDSTGQTLNMLVLRGVNDAGRIESVLKEYETKLKSVQPSSFSKPAAPPSVPQPLQPLSNGVFGGAPPTQQVRREEKTLQEGNTTRHITTESSTEQFGSSTLTKVTREEVSRTTEHPASRPAERPVSRPAECPVSRPTERPVSRPAERPVSRTPEHLIEPGLRPSNWQPKRVVVAPSGVAVHHNPDSSVTMTIGFSGGKENLAPQAPVSEPMFRVSKLTTETTSNVWQPASRPRPTPPAALDQRPTSLLPTQMDFQQMEPLTCDTGDMNGDHLTAELLRRMLFDGSGSDECHTPDSPFGRKKKIFADSSFYDDPEHKYPTIEEQIKMARVVALSLMSPANVTARGHKMFIKRRQKAQKWTTDDFGHLQDTNPEYFTFEEPDSEQEEKYYNPNPWRPAHTWEPPTHMLPQTAHMLPHTAHDMAHDVRHTNIMTPAAAPPPCNIPVPPPVPSGTGSWQGKTTDHYVDTNKRVLSPGESEQVRLYGQKTSHTGVSPQTCFSLAKDLRNMKGKGGRLFAKRKARVDKYVSDEANAPPPAAPTPELIKKLTGGMVPPPQPPAEAPAPVNSKPRLQQMIDMPKPAMTPWEAAQRGDVDKAFDHIDAFERQMAMANRSVPPTAASNPVFPPSQSMATPCNARMPDGVKKIQGWGASGNNRLSPGSSSTPSVGSSPFATSPQSSVASSVPGFRPVSFNIGQGFGDFRPSEAGVCDL